MFASLKEVFDIANERKIAIAQFNTPNLENLKGAVRAAERMGVPIILSHAECHQILIDIEDITPLMMYYAKKASVPVAITYDHGENFDLILKAIKLGYSGVMYDGSKLSYEENVARAKEIVKIAHSCGTAVEAELGRTLRVTGGTIAAEDAADANPKDFYTKPEDAKDYVERTGIDCLAIAYGASHGLYTSKPQLDFDVLKAIKKAVNVPLVLHGGSGLSAEDFQKSIEYGIRKINYYTYMAKAGGEATKEMVKNSNPDSLLYHDIVLSAEKAMEEDCYKTLKLFTGEN